MRTRDLKPDFWTDERVVSVSDAAKLLFQGLWNLADREGRLEDKPVTIGFKVRPWDPGAAPALLDELHAAGLIVRYEVAGAKLIGIPGLTTHQRIHPKEMASKLPDWAGLETSRVKVELSAASRGKKENSVSLSEPAGPSGSSEPSGPSEFPTRTKRAPVEKAPKVEKAPDPRHTPLVHQLDALFVEKRSSKYPFDGRAAKTVQRLLQRRPKPEDVLWPIELAAAWGRALDARFPDCSTLEDFERDLARYLGTGPPTGSAERATQRREEPAERPEGRIQL